MYGWATDACFFLAEGWFGYACERWRDMQFLYALVQCRAGRFARRWFDARAGLRFGAG